MTTKKVICICIGVFLLYAIGFGSMIWAIQKDKQALSETTNKLIEEQNISSSCSTTRDSLKKANEGLSKFKTLSMAMIQRDEIVSQLKHKVGDVVYMKNDSARVVIEDLFVGGCKYNFYIKFKVLYEDQSTKEVIPELIY